MYVYRAQQRRIKNNNYNSKHKMDTELMLKNINKSRIKEGSQDDREVIMEDCVAYGEVSAQTGGHITSLQRQEDNTGVYEVV